MSNVFGHLSMSKFLGFLLDDANGAGETFLLRSLISLVQFRHLRQSERRFVPLNEVVGGKGELYFDATNSDRPTDVASILNSPRYANQIRCSDCAFQ